MRCALLSVECVDDMQYIVTCKNRSEIIEFAVFCSFCIVDLSFESYDFFMIFSSIGRLLIAFS